MSKKNNQKIVINNEELKPTVLYTIKEKKASLLGVIIVFALFIGVVYFLPQATALYEKYTKKDDTSIPSVKPNNDKEEDDQSNDVPDSTLVKYNLSDNPTITNSDIIISDFTFQDGTLNFKITNAKANGVNLTNKKYYLEAYSASDTLVKRIKIAEDNYEASESKNYSYQLNSATVSYLYLKEIKPDDYPNLNLEEVENMATLTCSLDNEIVVYSFESSELKNISHTLTIKNTVSDYASQITTYQALATTYNGYNGITASLNAITDGFTFNTTIDLTKATLSNLNNNNYYAHKTKPNIVNFEMEARGYTCS